MAGRFVFKRGEFYPFVVVSEGLHLGGKLATTLQKGDSVLFDGYTLRFDGQEYVMPQVKGAVKNGWLDLEENFDMNRTVAPQPAGVRVRPAQDAGQETNRRPMGMPVVMEEERFVGNFRRIRDATEQARVPLSREEREAQRGRLRAERTQPRGAYVVDDDRRIVDYLNSEQAPPPQPVKSRSGGRQQPAREVREQVLDNHGQQGVAVRKLGKPKFDTQVTTQTTVPQEPNYASLNRGAGKVKIE